MPNQPERAQQLNIRHLVASLGGTCYVLGTTRRRGDYQGTMQTPGLPDLWIWLPAVPWRAGRELPIGAASPIALWWEVKAKGGSRSADQLLFADLAVRAGTPYGHGDLIDFMHWLVARGRLDPRNVSPALDDLAVAHG